MFDKIIHLDKELLIFLNGLGSPTYDALWLVITKQINWLPFFLVILYLLFKKIPQKQLLYTLLFVAVLILVCDQTTNLFKNTIQRLRPCNDLEINSIIRIVKQSDSYSYFSGHAANSMATMMFLFLILRKFYKHAYLLFLFPLIFAYSRIYLGLHFPLDILSGYFFGAIFGILFYKLYKKYIINRITF